MTKVNIPFSIAVNAEQFLLGIAAEEAANTASKEKAFKRLDGEITRIREKLRDSYDALIPNVMVADADTLTNLISNRISENPEKFYEDASTGAALAKVFSDKSSSEYIKLQTRVRRLLFSYHRGLLNQQGSTNPIKDLNELSRRLFSRTSNIQNDISARVLGVSFGKAIRKVFGNRSVLAAIEPQLGSSSTVFVFFSSSFNSLGTSIRDKVYNPLIEYLRNRLLGGYIESKSTISIGSIANLGHAALVNDLGVYVNTPAFAKSLFTVAKGGSAKFAPTQLAEAASFFKKESKIIENKIVVNKNLTTEEGYAPLLALGVTFTNFEDAVINSDRGRKFEGPASRIIGQIPVQKLTSKQQQVIITKLYNIVLRLNPVLGRSGKNILEFVKYATIATLEGKKVKPVKYNSKKSVKYKKTIYTATDKKVTDRSLSKINTTIVPLNSADLVSSTINLASLMMLINSNLHDQIKRNMGTGDRRDVLNYRTGRFANSARVERVSESREGMITAFYSYMKNPYATFSRGGRQERPFTREPKLLISRSIRELAGAQVANRMRAVNV